MPVSCLPFVLFWPAVFVCDCHLALGSLQTLWFLPGNSRCRPRLCWMVPPVPGCSWISMCPTSSTHSHSWCWEVENCLSQKCLEETWEMILPYPEYLRMSSTWRIISVLKPESILISMAIPKAGQISPDAPDDLVLSQLSIWAARSCFMLKVDHLFLFVGNPSSP